MVQILANDGIAESGVTLLEDNGFKVHKVKVAADQLPDYINKNDIQVLLVRSATKVTGALLKECPDLQLVGRGGVGLDNVDLTAAAENGVTVFNTPAASSQSVAELVFAHIFSGVRFLHDANRNMPLEGDQKFKQLKKAYAKGIELKGKTLGIIGFGRIGQAVAKMALGLGMEVIFHDRHTTKVDLEFEFFNGATQTFPMESKNLEEVLQHSDFITLHLPAQKDYVIGNNEMKKMKEGAGLINASRGGIVDEKALLDALDKNHISFAGLDVFESEPQPEIRVLMHPKISLTPHTGASTQESQNRIGVELAEQIMAFYKENPA
ncbi:MAG: D-2-hydroxyacid dehydrogenase [Bacteroidota bacterium]